MRLTVRSPIFNRWFVALLGSLVASGCSDSVDLGGNVDAGSAVDGRTPAGVDTVYQDRNYFWAFAVDESTLYYVYPARGEPQLFWNACDLGSCAATVRTLYRRGPDVPADFQLPPYELAVANGEIFFPLWDELNAPHIAACPTAGCADAPRKVTPAIGFVRHLFATEEDVYWDNWNGGRVFRCAREGCTAPAMRDLGMLTRVPDSASGSLNAIAVAGDFMYVGAPFAVARLKRDLSADPDWVYQSDLPIRGVAVAGDWVYFGIATQAGELRRCPLSGCVGNPELVAPAQPRPIAIASDERALYWLNYPDDAPSDLVGGAATIPLDGQSTPRTAATGLKLRPDMHLRTNSHHVYWAETEFVVSTSDAASSLALSSIRSFAK